MRISDWSSDVCSSDLSLLGVNLVPSPARFGPDYTPKMVAAMASCSAAIARLDVGISVSSVASAWARRAAWSGYTLPLQLQPAEIDEIDVFSWGCGLPIPGRPRRPPTVRHDDRRGG